MGADVLGLSYMKVLLRIPASGFGTLTLQPDTCLLACTPELVKLSAIQP